MSRLSVWGFVGVLGLASVVSIVLLAMSVRTGLSAPDGLDYTAAGELLLVFVLSVEGVIAVRHFYHDKTDSIHQVLVPLLLEYRSPEMLWAVASLEKLYVEHPADLGQEYVRRLDAERAEWSKLADDEQLTTVKSTLHHRRRLVKQFYDILAGVYELKVIPKKVLQTYWTAEDLRIIPDIIIPLETSLAHALKTEEALPPSLSRLKRLYDDMQDKAKGRRLTSRWSRRRQ